MAEDGPLLALTGVSVQHHRGPEPAVDDVSLTLAPGESLVVTGPEGSGKTSLIYGILGLAGTSGEIQVLGRAPGDVGARSEIGFAPAGRPYPPGSACEEIVGLVGAVRGAPDREAVADALALAGLEVAAETEVDDLDSEQNRRLSLACALVGSPRLLLIDDAWASPETLAAVDAVKSTGGAALLTSSRDDLDERFGSSLALPEPASE